MAAKVATMMDLPREIFLMVCSYLSQVELASLSGVSRDLYKATQQPLYSHIRVESYCALISVLHALETVPLFSHISPNEGLHEHVLSGSQVSERDIKRLDIVLDRARDRHRITGYGLSLAIGQFSQKCANVDIHLTLHGLWSKFSQHFNSVVMPNVTELTCFFDQYVDEPSENGLLEMRIWEIMFSGSIFPDLRKIYVNTMDHSPASMSKSLDGGMSKYSRLNRVSREHRLDYALASALLVGLRNMEEVRFECNTMMNAGVLRSLFDSEIVPQRLTRLEIANCPYLDSVGDLEALAKLLQKGLRLLQFLKLHLLKRYPFHHDSYTMAYVAALHSQPQHHLCNIVRELGQNIKHLDLVVPFGCNRIFQSDPGRPMQVDYGFSKLPEMPVEPATTRPQRLAAAGYRYRRLIFNEYCQHWDEWDDMVALASNQEEKVSWELVYDGRHEQKAMWCCGAGHIPVPLNVDDIIMVVPLPISS